MKISKKYFLIGALVFMAFALLVMFAISRLSPEKETQTTQTEVTPNIIELKAQAEKYCEILYSDQSKQSDGFLSLLTSQSRETRLSEETTKTGTGVKVNSLDLPKIKDIQVSEQTVGIQKSDYVSINNTVTVTYTSIIQKPRTYKIAVVFVFQNSQWLIDESATLEY